MFTATLVVRAYMAWLYCARHSIKFHPNALWVLDEALAEDTAALPPIFCGFAERMSLRMSPDGELTWLDIDERTREVIGDVPPPLGDVPLPLKEVLIEGLTTLLSHRLCAQTIEEVPVAELGRRIADIYTGAVSDVIYSQHPFFNDGRWNGSYQRPGDNSLQLLWLEPRAGNAWQGELLNKPLVEKELGNLREQVSAKRATAPYTTMSICPQSPVIIKRTGTIWLQTAGGRDDSLAAQYEAAPLYAKWLREQQAWQFPSDRLGYLVTLLTSSGQSPLIISRGGVTNTHIAALLDAGRLGPRGYLAHALHSEDLTEADTYRDANPELAGVVEFARQLTLAVLTGTLPRDEAVALFEEQAAPHRSSEEITILYGVCGPDILQAASRQEVEAIQCAA